MTKRQITPHKGGRTARLDVRIRPETKSKIERMAKDHKVSVADMIEWMIYSSNENDFFEYENPA